jgi:hypothetical protein
MSSRLRCASIRVMSASAQTAASNRLGQVVPAGPPSPAFARRRQNWESCSRQASGTDSAAPLVSSAHEELAAVLLAIGTARGRPAFLDGPMDVQNATSIAWAS